jgi:hypothetical protein
MDWKQTLQYGRGGEPTELPMDAPLCSSGEVLDGQASPAPGQEGPAPVARHRITRKQGWLVALAVGAVALLIGIVSACGQSGASSSPSDWSPSQHDTNVNGMDNGFPGHSGWHLDTASGEAAPCDNPGYILPDGTRCRFPMNSPQAGPFYGAQPGDNAGPALNG